MTVKSRRQQVQEMTKDYSYDDSEYGKLLRRKRIRAAYFVCLDHHNFEFFYDMLDCTRVEELKEIIILDEQETKQLGRPFRTAIRRYLRDIS